MNKKSVGKVCSLLVGGSLCLTGCGTASSDKEMLEKAKELEGKKLCFLGSSVTYGSASGGWSMCEYLSEEYGCVVIKWAESGTTLVKEKDFDQSYVNRLDFAKAIVKDVDYFICQLSTNDASQNKPLGKISDTKDIESFDTATIIGAIEYIIATAQQEWGCHVSFYTNSYFESANYKSMVEALYQVQEKWGIGILDLYNDKKFNGISEKLYQQYMSDPIHPTKDGYKKWYGPKFVEHLLKYN